MKTDSSRNDPNKKLTQQQQRRCYIYERLLNFRGVSVEEIEWEISRLAKKKITLNRKSIEGDIQFWRKTLNWRIEKGRNLQRKVIWRRPREGGEVAEASAAPSRRVDRIEMNNLGKRKIARLAAGMILGYNKGDESMTTHYKANTSSSHCEELLTFSSVIEKLHVDCDPKIKSKIKKLLELYGDSRQRTVFLDSSTTVDEVADILSRVNIPLELYAPIEGAEFNPDKGRHQYLEPDLGFLEVWTNSREVFKRLGDMEVNVRTVILPGWQDPQNESLCSYLAGDFVERVEPHFGLTIVGAKAIDLEEGFFCTDHSADAKLVSQIMERSQITVVVADSSKLLEKDFGGAQRCCKLVGNIDFVITDQSADQFGDQINKWASQGVIFLHADDWLPDSLVRAIESK